MSVVTNDKHVAEQIKTAKVENVRNEWTKNLENLEKLTDKKFEEHRDE